MLNAGTVQAFATLNDTGFTSGMNRLKKQGDKFAQGMSQNFTAMGKTLTTSVTLPLALIGGAMIKTASDAEETGQKFDVVFGNISKKANSVAKELRDSFGLSSQGAQKLLGDTGDILTGLGFTQDVALDLSEQVAKLSVDLASFTNFSGGAEGASAALTKALLGEAESVKALGIVIRQDTKEYKAMVEQMMRVNNVGLVQAKALTALKMATDQSKNSIGDFARTQDSFANQSRQLGAELEDLAVIFGNEILPLATKMVGVTRGLIERFSGLSSITKQVGLSLAGIAFVAGPTLLFLGSLGKAYMSLVVILPKLIASIKLLTAAMVANPITAVAVAVTALGTAAFLSSQRVKDLREETQKMLDMDMDDISLEMINTQIDAVRKKIEGINKGSFSFLGIDFEKGRLKDLGDELALLEQKRKDLRFGRFRDELASASNNANMLSDSISRVGDSVERVANIKPVDFIFDVQDVVEAESGMDRLFNQMKQFENTFTLPEMIAPEGSIAKLQQNLAQLQLQLAYTADPTKFAMLKEQIEQTQLALDGMTSNATQSGNAMMGLANSIGNIFERAALQGENLSQVLKGIIKQLAARAFVTGIGALLTGGASLGDKGFLGTLFGGLFHSGGVVQGSGERMIRAKGGEMVLTKSQQKALSMGATAPSSGMSEGQIERAFSKAMSRYIRGVSERQIFEMSEKGRYN